MVALTIVTSSTLQCITLYC